MDCIESSQTLVSNEKTGKPFETPSLFKNVLLPFLNRLSYVQFVSGAPIFQGVSPSSLVISPSLCSQLCSLGARLAAESEPSFYSRVASGESPALTRCDLAPLNGSRSYVRVGPKGQKPLSWSKADKSISEGF